MMLKGLALLLLILMAVCVFYALRISRVHERRDEAAKRFGELIHEEHVSRRRPFVVGCPICGASNRT